MKAEQKALKLLKVFWESPLGFLNFQRPYPHGDCKRPKVNQNMGVEYWGCNLVAVVRFLGFQMWFFVILLLHL